GAGLDLSEVERLDGPVLDGDLVGLAGAVVGDGQGVLAHASASGSAAGRAALRRLAPADAGGQRAWRFQAGDEIGGTSPVERPASSPTARTSCSRQTRFRRAQARAGLRSA